MHFKPCQYEHFWIFHSCKFPSCFNQAFARIIRAEYLVDFLLLVYDWSNISLLLEKWSTIDKNYGRCVPNLQVWLMLFVVTKLSEKLGEGNVFVMTLFIQKFIKMKILNCFRFARNTFLSNWKECRLFRRLFLLFADRQRSKVYKSVPGKSKKTYFFLFCINKIMVFDVILCSDISGISNLR